MSEASARMYLHKQENGKCQSTSKVDVPTAPNGRGHQGAQLVPQRKLGNVTPQQHGRDAIGAQITDPALNCNGVDLDLARAQSPVQSFQSYTTPEYGK